MSHPCHVNSLTATRAPLCNVSRRGTNVSEQPAKRVPTWLTIDVLVIVISLAIIGVGIALGMD